jgi:glucan endo-1,3-beta-D-glucosidase
MRFSILFALVASSTLASAAFKGFSYRATFSSGVPKQQSDYELAFNAAKGIQGAPDFTTARLCTTIQPGTPDTPITTIPAALKTDTTLFLGIQCSGGNVIFNSELAALTTAITQYGQPFVGKIIAIAVGSQNLFRDSFSGMENHGHHGVNSKVIADYIKRVRDTLPPTKANKVLIGHADTWSAWVDPANKPVIDESSCIDLDTFRFFQKGKLNSIEIPNATFWDTVHAT